jgi:hypothetical protein
LFVALLRIAASQRATGTRHSDIVSKCQRQHPWRQRFSSALSAAFLAYMAGIDADLVVPRTARGYEPLCAVSGRACADPIRIRLERHDLTASMLPEGVKVAVVGPETLAAYDPDGLLFVNVNTPHDYERAKELLERSSKTSRDRIMDELGP